MNVLSQNFWVKDHRQIYLIGNPWVWSLSSLAVFGYIAARGFLILRAKRGYRDFENSQYCFSDVANATIDFYTFQPKLLNMTLCVGFYL